MVHSKRTWRRALAVMIGLILGYFAAGYAQQFLPGTAANAARDPAPMEASKEVVNPDEADPPR